MRFEQEATKETEQKRMLRSVRLLSWGGPVAESLCRLKEILRSGERARGFGREPMPCVRQSPRSQTKLSASWHCPELHTPAAVAKAPAVVQLMARELGKDGSWQQQQLDDFNQLAAGFIAEG